MQSSQWHVKSTRSEGHAAPEKRYVHCIRKQHLHKNERHHRHLQAQTETDSDSPLQQPSSLETATKATRKHALNAMLSLTDDTSSLFLELFRRIDSNA